jgi:L-glyceraldehyde 3-phosphate reductase
MVYRAADDRYEGTEYERVGRSGLLLPRVSLGLWNNFGFDRPLETQRAILRRAFDLGVTHFDLANVYGPPTGSVETNYGVIHAQDFRPYREELVIATKAGYHMGEGPYLEYGSRKHLVSSIDNSLRRMGLDYVDIYYSHRPDPRTPIAETMGALAHAVHSGKAIYVGVSNYTPEQTLAAAAALAEHKVPLLIHQPRYNMFDRHIEPALFTVLDELGIGSVVYSPLAQGLLTNRYLNGIPGDSRLAMYSWLSEQNLTEEYFERVKALNEIASARGLTLAQLALLWVLRIPQVTSALIGASSVAQLEDSVAAASAEPLTDDEIAQIEPLAVHGTGARP